MQGLSPFCFRLGELYCCPRATLLGRLSVMRTHIFSLVTLLSFGCGKDDTPIKVGSCMDLDTGDTGSVPDTGDGDADADADSDADADADADADTSAPFDTGSPPDTGVSGDTGVDDDTGHGSDTAEGDADDTGSEASVSDTGAPSGSDTGMPEAHDTGTTTEADTGEASPIEDTGMIEEEVVAEPPRFDETPEFLLPDVNESSELFGLGDISPFDYTGKTTAWYFTKASCGYCRSQYSLLNFMQGELETERPDLDIQIFAVNDEGAESYGYIMSALGDLPILQDTELENAWGDWDAVWRDVYVIDDTNHFVEVINLTSHSLGETENYDALKDLIVATSEGLR